jgi:hypothetical protein
VGVDAAPAPPVLGALAVASLAPRTAAAAHVQRVIPRHLRLPMTPSEALGFQCCFCGADITPIGEEPLSLTLPVSGGGVQELFCHTACLRSHVHPSVPLALDD